MSDCWDQGVTVHDFEIFMALLTSKRVTKIQQKWQQLLLIGGSPVAWKRAWWRSKPETNQLSLIYNTRHRLNKLIKGTINNLYSSKKFRPPLVQHMAWVCKLATPHVVRFLLLRSWCSFSFIQRLGFLFSVFKRGLAVVSNPYVSGFEPRGLPPLSLIIAFGPVSWQEMRDLFCLAWTTLFLPDYWCYFTPNNTALCLLPVQGQSLRGTAAFRNSGGRRGKGFRARNKTKRQRADGDKGKKTWFKNFWFGGDPLQAAISWTAATE